MHVRFVHGTELHVVLACRGVEPLDVGLLNGKRFDVFEPRRLAEVPEEPLEARRHEAREHSRRFGGRVPKCMEGSARHMQELPWPQRAPCVCKEDLDASLDHEEELVRVPVYMGWRAGRPCGDEDMEEGVVTTCRLADGEKIETLPQDPKHSMTQLLDQVATSPYPFEGPRWTTAMP